MAAINTNAITKIKDAIAKEIEQRMIAMNIPFFAERLEIGIEPSGSPIVTVTENVATVKSDEGYFDKELIMDGFADDCLEKVPANCTFREMCGETDKSPMVSYLEFRANNWSDMIVGLNAGLSEKNQIDPSILGKGVE